MSVIVVGGGAAGLIAAGTAAQQGEQVILIEKNEVLGKKIRITGKGRCNLTNNCEIEDMILQYPTNGKFLYSALYGFTNMDIVQLVESYGVKTKVERGGRIFPVSDKAADIVWALSKYALQQNVKKMHSTVKSLLIEENTIKGVVTDKGKIYADSVIIATGGKSYPATGSTGDGYNFARSAGHTVTEIKPSLVPLVAKESWVKDLMGLSLKNVELTIYNKKNKKTYSELGEMLFTHFGISGPLVLSASSRMKKMNQENYRAEIDLKPALSAEKLDERILRDFTKFSNKHLINSLDELLPKALIPVIIELCEINPHKTVNSITREERMRLCETFKHLPLCIVGSRPIEEGIVTSGGVKISEIDPATMESKICKNLYFAGEVVDVDGYTGGYNLQAAFSMGYAAGMASAISRKVE